MPEELFRLCSRPARLCVDGATVEEVTSNIREAIALHIESLREHGEDVPPATSRASSVRIA